jgi:Uma2 family endonuclease
MAISERPDLIGEGGHPYRSPWHGQRMTLDEFLALPEEKPYLEYVDGVVQQKMAPTPDHIELQAILRNTLNASADGRHLGRAFTEVRFVQDGVAFVPDVGYYRREHLQVLPGRRYAQNLGVPDIAIEVVSPEQRLTRQIQKCLRFLEIGAALSLVVDPEDEAVLVFRPGQQPVVLRGADRINLDDVLPGFTLTVEQMFRSIVPDWLVDEQSADSSQADDAAAPDRSEG